MTQPIVDAEFAALIPPLRADEIAQLEANIVQDGCREPLSVWAGHNVLLDGHNRLTICNRHSLPFKTVDIALDSRDDAMLWIIANQMGRRNLPTIDKIVLQEAREPILARKAKANQATSTGGTNPQLLPNLAKAAPIDVRAELAKAAGVSHGTYDAGKKVIAAVVSGALPADTLDKIRCHEESISGAAKKLAKAERHNNQTVYASMDVTVIEGDMLDVVPTLGKFDLVVADPPYNVSEWEWDKLGTRDDFLSVTNKWLQAVRGALNERYNLFWFCSPEFAADIEMEIRAVGLPIQSRIVWHRRNMAMGSKAKNKFVDSWEMIFHCGTKELNFPQEWSDAWFDVQVFAVPQTNFTDAKIHPTQKPLGLIERLVEFGSMPGDKILDPFAGSGTTGRASGGRSCVLIEKKHEYAEIIREMF